MKTLPDYLIFPLILSWPCTKERYIVDTNAYSKQVGAVFSRKPGRTAKTNGILVKFSYKSRSSYNPTKPKRLAVVWELFLLRLYLELSLHTARTDHSALRWTLNLADGIEELSRWHLLLLKYKFDVFPRPGEKHQAAYALSHLRLTDSKKAQLTTVSQFWQSRETYLYDHVREDDYFFSVVYYDEIHRLSGTTITLVDETTRKENKPTSEQKFIDEKSMATFVKRLSPP